MSNTEYFLPSKDKYHQSSNNKIADNDQYSNLNLNQNYKCPNLSPVINKSSFNEKKVFNLSTSAGFASNKRRGSSTSNKSVILPFSNYYNEAEENAKSRWPCSINAQNCSTLTLYIAKYENSLEDDTVTYLKNDGLKMKSEKSVLWRTDGAPPLQNPFEFPRQQEGDKVTEPEMKQFKASQRLLNPHGSNMGAELQPGETINVANEVFEVLQLLGRGGFGAVYKVKRLADGAVFAIKTSLNTEEGHAAMKKEIAILEKCSRIQSQHFFQLLASGEIDGRFHYAIMTFAGYDLSQLCAMDGKKKSLAVALILAKETLLAIKDFHIAGYLHCDIKADNFAVGPKGSEDYSRVFIFDFGESTEIPAAKDSSENAELVEEDESLPTMKKDIQAWFFMVVQFIDASIESLQDAGFGERRKNFFKKLPPLFEEIFDYINELEIDESPSYDFIISNINAALKKYAHTEILDWEKENDGLFIVDTTKPFYQMGQRENININYFGLLYNHEKGSTYKCNQKNCSSRLTVNDYDPSKVKEGQPVSCNPPTAHKCKFSQFDVRSKAPPPSLSPTDQTVEIGGEIYKIC